MKNCYGYVRVSTAKQGDGVSLEAQKDAILAYARNNNLVIVEWFEEKETAAKQGRRIFNAMVAKLYKKRNIDLVIHKIDRSARNFKDWAVIGDLNDAGVDIHFVTETLDFRSRGGRLSADIQAVIAADYIRNLREETLKGLRGRLEQGLYPFNAPLGYLDNGGGNPKTPDPQRAPLVKEMFELYATGQYSIRTLRIEMTNRGLTNRAGNPPSKPLIESMLSNSFYCGVIRISTTGDTFAGIHEPLISSDLFNRVQDVKNGKCGKKVTRHNHLYRGLFQCGLCHRSMVPEAQKKRVYYRCQTRDCPIKTFREDRIEEAVTVKLRSVKLTPVVIDRLTEMVSDWISVELNTNELLRTLRQKLSKTEDKLEALTDALTDRVIDNETFRQKREQLLLEKTTCQERLDDTAKSINAPDDVRAFLELAKNYVGLYKSAKGYEKRLLLEYATSNRLVYEEELGFKLSNWLHTAQEYAKCVSGAPTRPNSRPCPGMNNADIQKLITTAQQVRRDGIRTKLKNASNHEKHSIRNGHDT